MIREKLSSEKLDTRKEALKKPFRERLKRSGFKPTPAAIRPGKSITAQRKQEVERERMRKAELSRSVVRERG